MLGHASAVVAGGTESMSLVPMGGNKMSPNPALVDTYPDVYLTTGLVAENHARQSAVTREEQDAFALRSHQRAVAAIEAGRFKDEIVPVTVRLAAAGAAATGRGGQAPAPTVREVLFDTDEGPRRDTSVEALAKLKAAFHATGTVTAGNSSQMSDGAAAVVVTSAEPGEVAGTDAAGALRGLRHGRRARRSSSASGRCRPSGRSLQARRPLARRDRSDRAQRGLRRAGAGLPARAADRPRAAERQRRRDRARPSAGLHRRQAHRHAAPRDAPPRRRATAW